MWHCHEIRWSYSDPMAFVSGRIFLSVSSVSTATAVKHEKQHPIPKILVQNLTNKLHSRHQWSPCCEDSFCLLYTNGVLVQCSEFSVVKRDEDEKIWASRITKYSNWLKKNLFKILNWKKKLLQKLKTNPIFFVSVLNLKKKKLN